MVFFEWRVGWPLDLAWTLRRRNEIPAVAENQITII
jgi:hypothetical protein